MKKPDSTLQIQAKKIGLKYPTYFIADIAANHDGDIGRAKELIYLAADAGADADRSRLITACDQSCYDDWD